MRRTFIPAAAEHPLAGNFPPLQAIFGIGWVPLSAWERMATRMHVAEIMQVLCGPNLIRP